MPKKELKLIGFRMEPVGKEGDKILGEEKRRVVGKIYVNKDNKVIVKSKNKKIKKELQKKFDNLDYKNKFYLKKNGEKIYKEPGDPQFLEALRESFYCVMDKKIDGYAIIGSFKSKKPKKEKLGLLDKIISFLKGKQTKKLKVIGFKEKPSGKEIKKVVAEIYVNKDNKVIVKSKNKKIQEKLQKRIDKRAYNEIKDTPYRGPFVKSSRTYLREDGSVESIAQVMNFKKPGDPLFLEAIRHSVLDFVKKVDGWRINHLCCKIVKE